MQTVEWSGTPGQRFQERRRLCRRLGEALGQMSTPPDRLCVKRNKLVRSWCVLVVEGSFCISCNKFDKPVCALPTSVVLTFLVASSFIAALRGDELEQWWTFFLSGFMSTYSSNGPLSGASPAKIDIFLPVMVVEWALSSTCAPPFALKLHLILACETYELATANLAREIWLM